MEEILKDTEGELEVKSDGKVYYFKTTSLGWYEPTKIIEEHMVLEKDERRPGITAIRMEFAEIDMEILRKGIVEFKVDGTAQQISVETLKTIPFAIKDQVVQKISPNLNKEREKLKNLVKS